MKGNCVSGTPFPELPSYHVRLLESLASGVLVTDATGRILERNSAACAHLGAMPDELRPGTPLDDCPATRELQSIFHEIQSGGQPVLRREITLGEGDSVRALGLTASPLQEESSFQGVIFLFTDLTEVRRLEQEAAVNRQLAEIGELTAGVVHELRNPIGAISGYAELIRRQADSSGKTLGWALSILRETEGLRMLVDRFLSFSRPFEPRKSRFNAEELVERGLHLCQALAQERGVMLKVCGSPPFSTLHADQGLLTQALSNLLRNAIEFSQPEQQVEVLASTQGAFWSVQVLDSGPGISPDLVETGDLFKPFFTQRSGGTGLGLSIAHRAITAHGGALLCRNREEGGACFEMRIPLARAVD